MDHQHDCPFCGVNFWCSYADCDKGDEFACIACVKKHKELAEDCFSRIEKSNAAIDRLERL